MRWARTCIAKTRCDGRAALCALALLGCSHAALRPASIPAAGREPLVLASAMSEKDIAALENRCGTVVDVATDPSAAVLFRLEGCVVARSSRGDAGDAGYHNCLVMPLYPGHRFVDPKRYSPEAILRLVAPLKGKTACVVGAYEGLGQFYFYGLLPERRKGQATLR